ncbi:uncharacterized protein LOC131636888 [Vicia villosa]|uniref:uncharacterized protein LOC131636888 n=1 Tax=Vicia villosa TaxID=3911 RepID=UPI00273C4BFD|nr:uncharacterized protein LOC131636888 [Vicia villosa]
MVAIEVIHHMKSKTKGYYSKTSKIFDYRYTPITARQVKYLITARQSHPNAKDYRYTPISLFDKLVHAFGKDRATGKGAAPPVDNVEEIDKEIEELFNDEEDDVETTPSPSNNKSKRKLDNKDIHFNKRNKGASRLGVGKDVFDDSRNIMNELKKMELTEQERFVAADKILSVPHRLHIFMGCVDIDDRLAFVKSLMQ